jgi:hypothetical protein
MAPEEPIHRPSNSHLSTRGRRAIQRDLQNNCVKILEEIMGSLRQEMRKLDQLNRKKQIEILERKIL